MRMKSVLVSTLILYLFVLIQSATAASSNERCVLPPGLPDEISKNFPSAHIVTLADLGEYDRKLFRKDHGTRCPGLVKVNFYGDGKPTWALALISGEVAKRKTELLVARQIGDDWEF